MSALVVQYGLDAIDPGLPLVQHRRVETVKGDMFEVLVYGRSQCMVVGVRGGNID